MVFISKVQYDEGLVVFQGRLAFKQYMPDKPEKWGIKLWKMCDQNGFLYNCDVYTGASKDKEEDESTVDSVLKSLTEDIQTEYPYHLFADNFYSSIPLALKLLEKKIYYTGTLKENRKYIPKELKEFELRNKGDCAWISSRRGLVLIKFLDTKVVYFVTTAHTGCERAILDRKNDKGAIIARIIPKVADDYNQNMGRVDQHNQYTTYYTYGRRCLKWWQAVFFYMVSGILANSWITYKALHRKEDLNLLQFQELIIEHLIGNYTSRKRLRTSLSGEIQRVELKGHTLGEKKDQKKENCSECGKGRPSKRCINCDLPQDRHSQPIHTPLLSIRKVLYTQRTFNKTTFQTSTPRSNLRFRNSQ